MNPMRHHTFECSSDDNIILIWIAGVFARRMYIMESLAVGINKDKSGISRDLSSVWNWSYVDGCMRPWLLPILYQGSGRGFAPLFAEHPKYSCKGAARQIISSITTKNYNLSQADIFSKNCHMIIYSY